MSLNETITFIYFIWRASEPAACSCVVVVRTLATGGRCGSEAALKRWLRVERSKVGGDMAARMDDMFSFCVDPDKVAGGVEVRFIDNVKVRTLFLLCRVGELRHKLLSEGHIQEGCCETWGTSEYTNISHHKYRDIFGFCFCSFSKR